jgi:hypothetical protein
MQKLIILCSKVQKIYEDHTVVHSVMNYFEQFMSTSLSVRASLVYCITNYSVHAIL